VDTTSKPFTTRIQRTALNLAAKRVAQTLSVFVAGPLVDKDWTADQLAQRCAATRARLEIKVFIEDVLQHEVVFGEHRGIPEMGDANFGSQASIAIAEFALANDCEAIVIFPASVGSFCELGTWSVDEHLCQKMIIFADKKYQNDRSYMNLGTLRMAVNYGAVLHWCDLEDVSSIKGDVATFVQKAHDRIMVKAVTRGR
jgi:hypothetical protein